MTSPAASVPSLPWSRIRRVEATLSDSRNRVSRSSSDGKMREVQRPQDVHANEQREERQRQIAREQQIEQERRQGDQHDRQDPQDGQRQRHIGACGQRAPHYATPPASRGPGCHAVGEIMPHLVRPPGRTRRPESWPRPCTVPSESRPRRPPACRGCAPAECPESRESPPRVPGG